MILWYNYREFKRNPYGSEVFGMRVSIKYLLKGLARTLVLAALLALALTACGGGGDGEASDSEPDDAEPPEPAIKVGFIYNGLLENGTVNKIFDGARLQLEKNLGVETCYIEGVLVRDFPKAVDTLKEHDVNVIVSCSDYFANSCDKAAGENVDIKFISFGGASSSANLTSFKPLLYQPANVCGLAAAITGTYGSVGVVADHRMFNCAGVVNSYILGAKLLGQANLNVSINWASSDMPEDTAAAIDDMVGQGNDVIMLYQSTDYGIRYCEENGIKFIAFGGNLTEIAPNNCVSGFYFNVNSYITEQVRYIQNDMFKGSVTQGEMKAGYTRMTPLNEAISDYDYTKRLTDLLFDEIAKRESDGIFKGEIKDNFGKIQVPRGVTLSPGDVLEMSWMEISVLNNLKRFSDSLTEDRLISSDFIVRGEWPEPPPETDGDGDSASDAEPDTLPPDTDSSASDADSSASDTDSSVSDADSSVSDADSSVSDTDSSVSDTDSSVSDTDSSASDTDSSVSDTDSSASES
jgi:basic membrane lipoprotein Med (substrate-binding protein (PBP1-ABC) superfamily)